MEETASMNQTLGGERAKATENEETPERGKKRVFVLKEVLHHRARFQILLEQKKMLNIKNEFERRT